MSQRTCFHPDMQKACSLQTAGSNLLSVQLFSSKFQSPLPKVQLHAIGLMILGLH